MTALFPSTTNPWFVKIAGPAMAARRIVAFPKAGGTASSFRSWAGHVPDDCELLALQLPGRQKRAREKPLRRLETAVEQILAAFAALPPCKTTFLGDCMGSIIAYETIRAAAVGNMTLPERLVVACCYAPHLRPRRRDLYALPDDDLVAHIGTHGLVPTWLLQETETFRAFLPLLRCDYELAETYQHDGAGPIDVPITAVTASEDTVTPHDDVSEWRRHTSKEFALVDIVGGHDIATAQPQALLHLMPGVSASNAPA